jgi:hypothetical protein
MARTPIVFFVADTDQFDVKVSTYTGGTFGTATLWYDCQADPPAAPPSGFAAPFVQGITSGWNAAVGMGFKIRTNDFPISSAVSQLYREVGTGGEPPTVVDTASVATELNFEAHGQGPNTYNSKQWLFAPTAAKHITIYQSTNGGVAWSKVDEADSPGVSGKNLTAHWDGTSQYLYTAHVGTSSALILQEFDFDTEQWGTAHDTNTAITWWTGTHTASARPRAVRKLTNGNILIVYQKVIAAAPNNDTVFAAMLSGGTWTNDIQVSSNSYASQDYFNNIIVTPEGYTYIFWSQTHPSTLHPRLFVRQISDTGTLGTAYEFPDQVTGGVLTGNGVYHAGEVWIPYKYSDYGTATVTLGVGVWKGAPIPSPTWTSTLIDSGGGNYDYPLMAFTTYSDGRPGNAFD